MHHCTGTASKSMPDTAGPTPKAMISLIWRGNVRVIYSSLSLALVRESVL